MRRLPMRYLLFLLVALYAMPAQAVILSVQSSTSSDITVSNGDGDLTIRYDTLRSGNDNLRAADLQDRLNALATNQQLRSSLPLDDGTRLEDPGGVQGEREYWCDVDRNPTPQDDLNGTHLCSRADVVEDVFFDVNGQAVVTIRSSNDCAQDPTFPSCL